MAKKPMTKAQIVSHFAEKFEISKWAVDRGFLKTELRPKIFASVVAGMTRNMQDAIPLASWIIDLESASKDLGKRIGIGIG